MGGGISVAKCMPYVDANMNVVALKYQIQTKDITVT